MGEDEMTWHDRWNNTNKGTVKMKNVLPLIVSLLLIVLAPAGIVHAQDEAPLVMPGTETPESHTSGDSGECFVFAKYVIKSNPSEDGGVRAVRAHITRNHQDRRIGQDGGRSRAQRRTRRVVAGQGELLSATQDCHQTATQDE
jgi:hypothetical protein